MQLRASALRLTLVAALALANTALAGSHADTGLETQRQLFRAAYADAERGNWAVVDAMPAEDQRQLADYVLWPDLRAAYYRATLARAEHTELESFLDRYGMLRPARDLRYRYALHLARSGRLDEFLRIYLRYYQGLGEARLDCLALQAEIAAGHTDRIAGRAAALWMTGNSQVEECDPVFSWLADNGHLDRDLYKQRFHLAIEAGEFSRARWLARSIDEQHVAAATRWLRAQQSPASFTREFAKQTSDAELRAQFVYAVERLTYSDPVLALKTWDRFRDSNEFTAEQRLGTSRHIALWTARDGLPGAHALLAALPESIRDDEVMRWRARSSLREHDWTRLLQDIESMSQAERSSAAWRYWHAIALVRTSAVDPAATDLDGLARERDYYGFLAADELGVEYALDSRPTRADEAFIGELAKQGGIVRARELFLVGLDSGARSEWDAAVEHLDSDGKAQAAMLADRWNWHSRAIATAANAGIHDDLPLRYPLPYRDTFTALAGDASIPATWAYGVARSESLFMRDVRSSAGAIGLMQLMPATGRRVARQLRIPYSGIASLTDVEQNIRLGTTYLAQMAERYGGNRVLATAAYNAGPGRVDRWLPDSGDLDARIWIENIPFDETRAYVRRVLAAETIFHWRMTGQTRRLSEALARVDAGANVQRVARN